MPQISTILFSQLSEYFGRIDAEFYKPISLNADKVIKEQHHVKLGHMVAEGYRVVYENTKILSPDQIDYENDARFLQATNISNDGLWIEEANLGYVNSRDWRRYPKGRIQKGEVLIEVKGQAERVTIVQDYIPEKTLVTGSVFKLSLKKDTVSHEYLFAFFSSKYGKVLRDRTKVNTLIAYVSKPELYRIPIPIPNPESHTEVTSLVIDSFNQQKLSKDLYSKAKQLLDEALGLTSVEFKKEKSYTALFSEIILKNRSDADYYQTKYRQLTAHLEKINTLSLGSICTIKKGFEVGSAAYTDNGPLFIRVSNLNKEGFVKGNSDKYISETLYNLLNAYQPNIGDVLLTKDGTIGTCYVVDEEIDGIISGGILNLTLTNSKIPKEYLALVINSKACSMQANRDCSGALILHWKPVEIRKLRIPILSDSLMHELAELAYNSKVARRESKQLLEQAKQKVEALIEQAAQRT